MDSPSLSIWQSLKLKATLLAIPSYVFPRAILQHCCHKLVKVRCPSQIDLIRNHVIRWLGSSLDYQQLRVATQAPKIDSSILARNSTLLDLKAANSKVQEKEFNAFWVPHITDSEYTVLFVHGGGFTSGSTAGCARYLIQMATELCKGGVKCRVLSIDYDLSPEAQFPAALSQVSAAYAHAVSLAKPIILVGDSAGGHLCMSLLRHIHTPHPQIEGIPGAQIPKLLVLNSPWVDLNNTGASVRQNQSFDCVDKSTLDRWSRQYLGSSGKLDTYTDHSNPKNCWKGVLPENTLITAGEFECFISDIRQLALTIEKDRYDGLELLVEPLKCHAWPAVDFAFGTLDNSEIGAGESAITAFAMKGLRYQVDWILKHCGQKEL
ncbi:Alpha/Beta hydrolase protein [Cadophora sp. MPI-SDFR-AT-0126]|nr:Alpha/Beta hydrolase protein [Leotiomycetes sp. MPI-SDFR-AT-0126]